MSDQERIEIEQFLNSLGYVSLTIQEKRAIKTPRYIQIVMRNAENNYIYFSVMCLTKNKYKFYYDHTTLGEWLWGIQNANRFFFLIYRRDETSHQKKCHLLTPKEMLHYTSLPPYKIAINIKASVLDEKTYRADGTLGISVSQDIYSRINKNKKNALTEDSLKLLIEEYANYI